MAFDWIKSLIIQLSFQNNKKNQIIVFLKKALFFCLFYFFC